MMNSFPVVYNICDQSVIFLNNFYIKYKNKNKILIIILCKVLLQWLKKLCFSNSLLYVLHENILHNIFNQNNLYHCTDVFCIKKTCFPAVVVHSTRHILHMYFVYSQKIHEIPFKSTQNVF